jgi:RNA polymerase sigma-70 factor (ECF subfamily)
MDRSATTPSLELLLRQGDWLRRLAASLAVDAAHADDLTQQALLAALERPALEVGHARAWLATVVRRLARRERIDAGQRSARERAVAADERLPPSREIVARAEVQHEVSAALLALEEPYRAALLLRFYDELKPAAIARLIEAPVETVRTRIKRGLELLRAALVAKRSAQATGRRDASEWAVALVGLLDRPLRHAVRRAVVAKTSAATFAAGGVGTLGVLGVVAMSLKLKLAIAGLVVAAGAFAGWRLLPDGSRRIGRTHDDLASAHASDPAFAPAPATAGSPAPAPAIGIEATRAPVEAAAVSKPTDASQPPGCEIVGTVRTAAGAPVAGTLILLEDLSARSGDYFRNGNDHGTFGSPDSMCNNIVQYFRDETKPADPNANPQFAAADGGFRFTHLKAGARINLAAIHRVEGTAIVAGVVVEAGPKPQQVDVVLVPGIALFGTVRDELGRPVAKASIGVSHIWSWHETGTASQGVGSVSTDASGSYRTIPFPFERIGIGASATGFFEQGAPEVDAAPGERERRVDFELVRAPTFHGPVLLPSGAPADLKHVAPPADDHGHGGVELYASERDPHDPDTHHFGGDRGALDFELDRYEVTPHHPNARFISVWCKGVCLGAATIEKGVEEIDVTIDVAKIPPTPPPPQGVLVVEVVDGRNGAPIPSFHVTWSPDSAANLRSGGVTGRQYEDPAGRKRITGLEPGLFHVHAWADGFAPIRKDVRVAAPASADGEVEVVRFALQLGSARVAGRVVRDDGRPLSEAEVILLTPDGGVALPAASGRFSLGDDGRFAFERLVEGDYVVVATSSEVGPASALVHAAAKPEEVVLSLSRGCEVIVKPYRRGATLGGPFSLRIRDERGAPVVDGLRFGVATWTGDGGSRVRLAPGIYTAEVLSPGFEVGRKSFTATADAVVEVEMLPAPEGQRDR